jgi:hypothetical protein
MLRQLELDKEISKEIIMLLTPQQLQREEILAEKVEQHHKWQYDKI